MVFFGLIKDRSQLKQRGLPGFLYCFSDKAERDKWVKASWRRIEIKEDHARKYIDGSSCSQWRLWIKENIDKDLEEDTELDEIIKERQGKSNYRHLNIFDYIQMKG